MPVSKVFARQIFDSRGNPTVEVDVQTEKGMFRAAVPSGASTGIYEALEMRDKDPKFYHGKGVSNAINNVNSVIAPALVKSGLDEADQNAVDKFLLGLDGTENKSKLGANAILGVSLAVCKAGAAKKGVPLYRHIADLAGNKEVILPVPAFNVINGGSHAGNKLAMQEFMILPTGASSFKEAMRMGSEVYHHLKSVIKKKYGQDACNVGDEGGFAPNIQDNKEGLDLLVEAIEKAGYTGKIKIGMDVAASEFFKESKYDLDFKNSKSDPAAWLSSDQLGDLYKQFIDNYPIVSIEDPYDQDDWEAYSKLTGSVQIQIVGDDLLVTNPKRVQKGIDVKACNCLLLKVNQIGSVTESIEAWKMSKDNNWGVMVSHRSGETEDTFIADLVVGLCTGQIKTGAPCRSERLAKYNQILRIEEELGAGAKFAGEKFRYPYTREEVTVITELNSKHDCPPLFDVILMMDSDEKSRLVPNERHEQPRSYGGQAQAFRDEEDNYAYDNTSFNVEYEGIGPSEIEDSGGSRSRSSGVETESAADILYRLRYSFLDPDLDPEQVISETQDSLTGQDQLRFKESILDGIKEVPLSMKEKLRIRRVITTTERVSRRSRSNQQKYISSNVVQKEQHGFPTSLGVFNHKTNSLLWEYSGVLFHVLEDAFLPELGDWCHTLRLHRSSADYYRHIFAGSERRRQQQFWTLYVLQGDLSKSLLFYGIYEDNVQNFDLPLSYFLTWIAVNVLTVLYLATSMYVRYRRSKLSDTGSDFPFTWSMFCYFDFTINTKAGVKVHLKAFGTDLKEKIREEKSLEVIHWLKSLKIYFLRLVSNILVLGLLGGSGYLIYFVAQQEPDESDIDLDEGIEDLAKDIYERYRLAAVVAILKLVIPSIFKVLVKIESYQPRTELKFTLARTTFFHYASLIVFITSLTKKADCAEGKQVPTTSPFPSFNTTTTAITPQCTTSSCWENIVGEEIFKLILVDLGVCILVGLLFDVIKAVFVKCRACCCKMDYSEFVVTSNVLDLVYGQGLVWLGLYFSPLMALVAVVKLVTVFYFRYLVAYLANIPPKKMFRASRSGSFYLFLLLITWILCFIPVVYILIEKTPSRDCGPFETVDRAYKVIDLFDSLDNLPSWLTWVKDALDYIATAIVIVPVIVVLILLVLYYRVKSSSYNALIQELRKQLVFERKIERKKIFARALSVPALGSLGKASGSAITGEMSRKQGNSTTRDYEECWTPSFER
uniref:Enolase n=1 Tax=Crassostrea virginica TaxID=6565 RepID=A0A8B8E8R0_CRAVI|nr:uncharacterized protein LOC111132341 [Crassostrea virginica]